MGDKLQMPVENLRTAICLDCRQGLDEITQIARDVLQIVLHEITPCRPGQFSRASGTFLLDLAKL